jgi:hypothetical protein
MFGMGIKFRYRYILPHLPHIGGRANMLTGVEGYIDTYPTPDQLWDATFSQSNQWRDLFAAIPFEDRSGTWEARYYQHNTIKNDYPADFFDFIIIDECHRGGASDESNWRGILDYFSPAVQLGLTATPKRTNNADTYAYCGDPVAVPAYSILLKPTSISTTPNGMATPKSL